MTSEWRKTTIGELLAANGGSVKTGPFGTALKANEYSRKGVPLISAGEVHHGWLQIHDKTPRAPREVVDRLPEYVLDVGDIVFGRKGAVDRSAIVRPEQAGWFLGSDGIRLRLPTIVDARFVAYQLRSQTLRAWLLQHATGTTMASLNQAIIERIPVTMPPLAEQRAIAHILGTLDDKIELNRRMSETLEAMARALFKSWFVDFDPVRAKAEGRDPGLPKQIADLFPDRFVESELGEIPEGWEVGVLDDLLLLQRGFDLPSDQRRPGLYPVLAASGPSGTHDEFKVRGPGVTTGRSGVLGNVFFVHGEPLNTSLWVKEFRRSRPAFAYHLLRRLDFGLFNAGSAVPTLNRNHVANLPAVLPPMALIDAFERTAMACLDRQHAVSVENRTLAMLRDALLPKLISGELRVKDASEAASVAA